MKKKSKITKNEEGLLALRQTAATLNNMLLTRAALAHDMDLKKDINFECDYPDSITVAQYKGMFDREGIGTRVVKVMPEECWAISPEIYETEENRETEFEKVWKEVQEKRRIFHYLQRIDIISGIGNYGILLLGLDDGKELSEPVEGINATTGEKEGKVERKLLYLKPFGEWAITISTKEINTKSPRYGMPVKYAIQVQDVEGSNISQTKEVHWTRVIHIADNRECSDVYGIPRMQSVYNRLLDTRKTLGGSAEMFWSGAFPGMGFETNPEAGETALDLDSIKEQMDLYKNSIQRYLAMEGVSIKQLSSNVADPTGHMEAQLNAIAIGVGIPRRILQGSEEAKLASITDKLTWNGRVARRQNEYLTSLLIRPFIDRLITFGILPEVLEYQVDWPDLNSLTDEDRARIAGLKTDAIVKYVAGGADQLVPPMEFLTMFLGFTQDEAQTIIDAGLNYVNDNINEEQIKKSTKGVEGKTGEKQRGV